MLLPDVAQMFQSMGYNALIYDPRSIGESDGTPRNQIDPLKQAEDLAGERLLVIPPIVAAAFCLGCTSTHAGLTSDRYCHVRGRFAHCRCLADRPLGYVVWEYRQRMRGGDGPARQSGGDGVSDPKLLPDRQARQGVHSAHQGSQVATERQRALCTGPVQCEGRESDRYGGLRRAGGTRGIRIHERGHRAWRARLPQQDHVADLPQARHVASEGVPGDAGRHAGDDGHPRAGQHVATAGAARGF
nr:polyketide transferase [Quercus suber]